MPSSTFILPFRPAFDSNGLPVAGAKLFFYLTGTTTLTAVYADAGMVTELTNPVIASSAARFPKIYLNTGITYRVVLTDPDGVVLDDSDPYTYSDIGGTVDTLNNQVIGGVKNFTAGGMTLGLGDGTTPANFATRGANSTGTNVAGGTLTYASGTGTGNAAASTIIFQTPAVGASGAAAQALVTRMTLGPTGIVAPNLSGTNTGDQTSIVGITGTMAQFNAAVTDGDFVTGGGTAVGTNTGDQTTITGNAGTATALQTARAISVTGKATGAGVNFDGTAAIALNLTAVTLVAADIPTITQAQVTNLVTDLGNKQPLDTQLTDIAALAYAGNSGKVLAVNAGATAFEFIAPAGGGTVTTTSVVTANGISGSVATATTTPAITLTLGAITPTSVAASGTITGSNFSGTNTGDQTITLTGNVTGSGTGSFATTIANDAVTYAKVQNTSSISILLGRGSASGAGDLEEIALGTNLTMSGTTLNASAPGLADGDKGDIIVSGGGASWTIDSDVVDFSKMQNVASGTIFYRKTALSGDPEVQTLATLKTDLGLTGTNSGDQTITLTGDVTGSGTGSFATTIGAAKVTLAMQANMASSSLVYRKTAGAGAPEINTLATLKTDLGLTGTNSGDQTITLTGAVTGTGSGTFATTIAASPALTGSPTAPTAAIYNNSTQIATTAFVDRMRYLNSRASASPTFALDDAGGMIRATGNATIPANASVAFPIDSIVTVYNDTAASITVAITTDTLRLHGTATTGTRTIPQRGFGTFIKVAATEWVATGDVT